MNVIRTYYLFLFSLYKFIGGCLYFPSNLKDIKDHVQDAVVDGLYNKFAKSFYNKE